jgi:hypothetical protein
MSLTTCEEAIVGATARVAARLARNLDPTDEDLFYVAAAVVEAGAAHDAAALREGLDCLGTLVAHVPFHGPAHRALSALRAVTWLMLRRREAPQ